MKTPKEHILFVSLTSHNQTKLSTTPLWSRRRVLLGVLPALLVISALLLSLFYLAPVALLSLDLTPPSSSSASHFTASTHGDDDSNIITGRRQRNSTLQTGTARNATYAAHVKKSIDSRASPLLRERFEIISLATLLRDAFRRRDEDPQPDNEPNIDKNKSGMTPEKRKLLVAAECVVGAYLLAQRKWSVFPFEEHNSEVLLPESSGALSTAGHYSVVTDVYKFLRTSSIAFDKGPDSVAEEAYGLGLLLCSPDDPDDFCSETQKRGDWSVREQNTEGTESEGKPMSANTRSRGEEGLKKLLEMAKELFNGRHLFYLLLDQNKDDASGRNKHHNHDRQLVTAYELRSALSAFLRFGNEWKSKRRGETSSHTGRGGEAANVTNREEKSDAPFDSMHELLWNAVGYRLAQDVTSAYVTRRLGKREALFLPPSRARGLNRIFEGVNVSSSTSVTTTSSTMSAEGGKDAGNNQSHFPRQTDERGSSGGESRRSKPDGDYMYDDDDDDVNVNVNGGVLGSKKGSGGSTSRTLLHRTKASESKRNLGGKVKHKKKLKPNVENSAAPPAKQTPSNSDSDDGGGYRGLLRRSVSEGTHTENVVRWLRGTEPSKKEVCHSPSDSNENNFNGQRTTMALPRSLRCFRRFLGMKPRKFDGCILPFQPPATSHSVIDSPAACRDMCVRWNSERFWKQPSLLALNSPEAQQRQKTVTLLLALASEQGDHRKSKKDVTNSSSSSISSGSSSSGPNDSNNNNNNDHPALSALPLPPLDWCGAATYVNPHRCFLHNGNAIRSFLRRGVGEGEVVSVGEGGLPLVEKAKLRAESNTFSVVNRTLFRDFHRLAAVTAEGEGGNKKGPPSSLAYDNNDETLSEITQTQTKEKEGASSSSFFSEKEEGEEGEKISIQNHLMAIRAFVSRLGFQGPFAASQRIDSDHHVYFTLRMLADLGLTDVDVEMADIKEEQNDQRDRRRNRHDDDDDVENKGSDKSNRGGRHSGRSTTREASILLPTASSSSSSSSSLTEAVLRGKISFGRFPRALPPSERLSRRAANVHNFMLFNVLAAASYMHSRLIPMLTTWLYPYHAVLYFDKEEGGEEGETPRSKSSPDEREQLVREILRPFIFSRGKSSEDISSLSTAYERLSAARRRLVAKSTRNASGANIGVNGIEKGGGTNSGGVEEEDTRERRRSPALSWRIRTSDPDMDTVSRSDESDDEGRTVAIAAGAGRWSTGGWPQRLAVSGDRAPSLVLSQGIKNCVFLRPSPRVSRGHGAAWKNMEIVRYLNKLPESMRFPWYAVVDDDTYFVDWNFRLLFASFVLPSGMPSPPSWKSQAGGMTTLTSKGECDVVARTNTYDQHCQMLLDSWRTAAYPPPSEHTQRAEITRLKQRIVDAPEFVTAPGMIGFRMGWGGFSFTHGGAGILASQMTLDAIGGPRTPESVINRCYDHCSSYEHGDVRLGCCVHQVVRHQQKHFFGSNDATPSERGVEGDKFPFPYSYHRERDVVGLPAFIDALVEEGAGVFKRCEKSDSFSADTARPPFASIFSHRECPILDPAEADEHWAIPPPPLDGDRDTHTTESLPSGEGQSKDCRKKAKLLDVSWTPFISHIGVKNFY